MAQQVDSKIFIDNKKQSNSLVLFILMASALAEMVAFIVVFPLFSDLFINQHIQFINPQTTLTFRHVYYGIAVSLWPAGAFIGTAFLGEWSDKVGRKYIIVLCFIISGLTYLLGAICIVFHLLWIFLISRFVSGFFGGILNFAQTAAADISKSHQKAHNVGLITIASSAGMVFGPVIGPAAFRFLYDPTRYQNASKVVQSVIQNGFSLSLPFWFSGLICIVSAIVVSFVLQDTYKVYPEKNIKLSKIFSSFMFIFSDIRVVYFGIIFFLYNIGWGIFFSAIPLVLGQVFHYGHNTIGLFYCLMGAGNIFAIKFLKQKETDVCLLKKRCTIVCLMIVAFLISSVFFMKIEWLAVVIFVFALLEVIGYSFLIALASNAVTPHEQGKTIGALGSISNLSYALAGVLLMGISNFGIVFCLLACAVIYLLCTILLSKTICY